MAVAFPAIAHLLGSCLAIIHLLGLRIAGVLVLCIRGTLGKGTLRMYPSFRVPTTSMTMAAAATENLVAKAGGNYKAAAERHRQQSTKKGNGNGDGDGNGDGN